MSAPKGTPNPWIEVRAGQHDVDDVARKIAAQLEDLRAFSDRAAANADADWRDPPAPTEPDPGR